MPPPVVPFAKAVRCHLTWQDSDGLLAGSRFYLAYAGSAPLPADCTTIATGIGTAWGAHGSPVQTNEWTLIEVDVLDIASDIGSSSETTVSHVGTVGTDSVPSQVCMNVEFDIARRYRGGKPRIFVPGPPSAGLADNSHWNSSTIGAYNSALSGFFTAVEAISAGSVGALTHNSISFYDGYDENPPPTGRWRGPGHKYPPLPRTTAQFDPVEGYSAKAVCGSQRRRRTATTP